MTEPGNPALDPALERAASDTRQSDRAVNVVLARLDAANCRGLDRAGRAIDRSVSDGLCRVVAPLIARRHEHPTVHGREPALERFVEPPRSASVRVAR